MRRKEIQIYLFFLAVHSQQISDQNSMVFAIISQVEGNLVLKVKALSEGVGKVCSISDENLNRSNSTIMMFYLHCNLYFVNENYCMVFLVHTPDEVTYIVT
jgi:hypothetical protein